MPTTTIKKDIFRVIDKISDDNFLKAIYAILWDKSKEGAFELSPNQKEILDGREAKRKKGLGKEYSWEDAKRIIRANK